jgi:hypothetical protein
MLQVHATEHEYFQLGRAIGLFDWLGDWHNATIGKFPQVADLEKFVMDKLLHSDDKIIQSCITDLETFFENHRQLQFNDRVAQEAHRLAVKLKERINSHSQHQREIIEPFFAAHNIFPPNVKSDFHESILDFTYGQYRSSVTMARRSLQAALESRGVTKGANLGPQIEEAAKKGLITNKECQTAHATQKLGNFGAHPQEDDLDDIDEFVALNVLNATSRILERMFKS